MITTLSSVQLERRLSDKGRLVSMYNVVPLIAGPAVALRYSTFTVLLRCDVTIKKKAQWI